MPRLKFPSHFYLSGNNPLRHVRLQVERRRVKFPRSRRRPSVRYKSIQHIHIMATVTMEATKERTSQVRIHLQTNSEDIQLPETGPILVSTGRQHDLLKRKGEHETKLYVQNFAATNCPHLSTAYWRPKSPYRWNF